MLTNGNTNLNPLQVLSLNKVSEQAFSQCFVDAGDGQIMCLALLQDLVRCGCRVVQENNLLFKCTQSPMLASSHLEISQHTMGPHSDGWHILPEALVEEGPLQRPVFFTHTQPRP